MRLQRKYMLLKAVTIFLGALTIPWSTFTGFCFGDGRYALGTVSLMAQTAAALADGYIWLWVLENMRLKIARETTEPVPQTEAKVCPLFQGNGDNGKGAAGMLERLYETSR